jgi:hypothetical protein
VIFVLHRVAARRRLFHCASVCYALDQLIVAGNGTGCREDGASWKSVVAASSG